MPLDINAFRTIASENPDKLVYVQGDSLKTTRNAAHHSKRTYKAATDAFLSAYRQHYGTALGDALQRHLETADNAGKPLTTRTIKALVAFADEKMGSSTTIEAGGKAINLSKVGTDSMSRTGFRQATKIAKAEAGQRSAASATLAALKFDANGKVDLAAVLRHLNTFHAYIDRETTARSAAQGSNDAKTTNAKTDETLKSHGMGAVDSKQIVDMIENAIRSRPQDFPLLTKYYLNAEA